MVLELLELVLSLSLSYLNVFLVSAVGVGVILVVLEAILVVPGGFYEDLIKTLRMLKRSSF